MKDNKPRYKNSVTGKKVLREYTRQPSTRWFKLIMSETVTPHVSAPHLIHWTNPLKVYQDNNQYGVYRLRYNLVSDRWELWHNPFGV